MSPVYIQGIEQVVAHAAKHQDTGADEVSVAALSGELADRQKSKTGDSTLGWTDQKLKKGAGAGADPTEIDVPGGLPSGLIVMWHGLIANIPSGWIICDGNSGTPNLLAKFVEGVATAATNPGTTGGAATHTLTEAQIPAHTHGTGGDHYHGVYSEVAEAGGGYLRQTEATTGSAAPYGDGGHAHDSFGGGGAHPNRPPFYDIAFIMKT